MSDSQNEHFLLPSRRDSQLSSYSANTSRSDGYQLPDHRGPDEMPDQREQYQLPEVRRASEVAAPTPIVALVDPAEGKLIDYFCAHGFPGRMSLYKKDPVRCTQCGHVVLFKAKTKR